MPIIEQDGALELQQLQRGEGSAVPCTETFGGDPTTFRDDDPTEGILDFASADERAAYVADSVGGRDDSDDGIIDWAQCDVCGKWRALPAGMPVPDASAPWRCADLEGCS